MGDMGQRKEPRRQKRSIRKRRPSRKGRAVLGWLPDSIRPRNAAGKAAISSWLGRSFMLSNPRASAEWIIGDDQIQEMATNISSAAHVIADDNTDCEVSIERPENGYPLWGATIEMIVDGQLERMQFESASLNDVYESSIGWISSVGAK